MGGWLAGWLGVWVGRGLLQPGMGWVGLGRGAMRGKHSCDRSELEAAWQYKLARLPSASPFIFSSNSASPLSLPSAVECRKSLLQRKGMLVNMTGDENTLRLASGEHRHLC